MFSLIDNWILISIRAFNLVLYTVLVEINAETPAIHRGVIDIERGI